MCLDKLEKLEPCKVGYKIFQVTEKGLVGEYYGVEEVRPKRRWLNEKDFRPKGEKRKVTIQFKSAKYPKGWHIWHLENDAIKWVYNFPNRDYQIWKVKVRNFIATGWQSGEKITVAKEILISEICD